ncbi:MAG: hypothetical protein ACSHX3_08735 [Litorimonas sp.]
MPSVKFEKTGESNVDFRDFAVRDSQGEFHDIQIDASGGYTVQLPTGESRLNYRLTGRPGGYIDVDRTHGDAAPKSDRYEIGSGHTKSSFRLFKV